MERGPPALTHPAPSGHYTTREQASVSIKPSLGNSNILLFYICRGKSCILSSFEILYPKISRKICSQQDEIRVNVITLCDFHL